MGGEYSASRVAGSFTWRIGAVGAGAARTDRADYPSTLAFSRKNTPMISVPAATIAAVSAQPPR